MRRWAFALALGLAIFRAQPAAATKFRHPSTCHAGCITVTAYFDLGGTKDWGCGKQTYGGHKGTDFGIFGTWQAMDAGRDIVAGADGKVIESHDGEFDRCNSGNCAGGGGFGNYVKLQHGDGKITIYGHMRKGTVAVGGGQQVACGQKLGQVGSSGFSTGPHVHFEVRVNNAGDDPFGGGPCGGPLTYWVEQGPYKGLPGTKCEGGPPPPPPPPPADMAKPASPADPADPPSPPDLSEGAPDRGTNPPSDGEVIRDAGPSGAWDRAPPAEGGEMPSGVNIAGGCAVAARPARFPVLAGLLVLLGALARMRRRRR
ncbi:MAG: M23 family metallopeptidase [Myxococcales bacterium]|nr:M23 family metallopeptidase [Myxococcales bacterium]